MRSAKGKDLVNSNNLDGHQERFDKLMKSRPRDEALELFVGGAADRVSIGFREVEAIGRFHDLNNARIVDIGCGIGRMTAFLPKFPIASYLGTDIIKEVLDVAAGSVKGDKRFKFKLVDDFIIPAGDKSVDIASAFSVMTHLLDEEVFSYFSEASRCLVSGGVLVFSFLDFQHTAHRKQFLDFALKHKSRPDVLKWFEKDTLSFFAEQVGLEVIEFQDSGDSRPSKYPNYEWPDGRRSGGTFAIGQSIIYARKP
jgi:SAM-dependent methyltransferase